MTQNNLGNAYWTLAEVQDKAENCLKAIEACEEALKVHTLEQFSMDYAMAQNNIGNAYVTLAEVEDKAENGKRAIQAYQEALEVHTLDSTRWNYADDAKQSRKCIRDFGRGRKQGREWQEGNPGISTSS